MAALEHARPVVRPVSRQRTLMNEQEERPITITHQDISQANQLSLHCPICAGAVEQNVDGESVVPVFCVDCGTLYHRVCWEQNGGKCAILGCQGKQFRVHGALDLGPVLKINERDIQAARPVVPPHSAPATGRTSDRTKKLKRHEQQMQREMRRHFWLRNLFESLLRAIRIWPSDPS